MKINETYRSIPIAIFIIIVFIVFSGCKGGKSGESGKADNVKGLNDIGSTPEPGNNENSGGEKPSEKNTAPTVDPKEVDAITGYGEFRIPGSELLQHDTRHQQFSEGTEIWVLNFACPQPYRTVADWYRDHVEKGARISETKLTDGSDVTIIEYQSTEEKFTKNISVISMAGNKACKIRVNLTRNLMPEKISPGKTSRGK